MKEAVNSPRNRSELWQASVAPVAHFEVLRALPSIQAKAIGPFVFLDHFGPALASPDTLAAHPHAGIEVMTYLIEGANEHRDSLGHTGIVKSGGAQWMRAGSGILHAETNLPNLNPNIHGLQIWARMPINMQDDAPQYCAIQASEVVEWMDESVQFRLIGGQYGSRVGPIQLAHKNVMLHIKVPAKSEVSLSLSEAGFEYCIYGISGEMDTLTSNDLYQLRRGSMLFLADDIKGVILQNVSSVESHVMLLGGSPAERPLYFGGPFVLDSQAALMAAQERYFQGKMGTLDGVPF